MYMLYTLEYTQSLPISQEEAWSFFSDPYNLRLLTPDYLQFELTTPLYHRHIYPGQIIAYTLRPLLFLPIEWVTEITHVDKLHYFIDEQRLGPYKLWHHEHRFNPISNGVEVQDRVVYKMPFGILGKLVHQLKVKKDLEFIFAYRKQKLIEIFGTYDHA